MSNKHGSLAVAIATVADKLRKFHGRTLGEQNTKATLIEPILEALGWDIRDPDEVHREFKPTPRDSPVDYALKLLRNPRLFVEAKGLGEDLSDRRWVAQVLGYATVAGVEWCVLTDGDEYRFYNATAPVDADEKMFCRLRLTESPEENAAHTLSLISRANMEGNQLDVLWSAKFVDRRVKTALERMFDIPDKGLVRLLQRRAGKLTPKEIAESLRRLDVRVEQPALPRELKARNAAAQGANKDGASVYSRAARKAWETRRKNIDVTLKQLIDAGMLKTPAMLFRRYKGTHIEATLLPNGELEFQGSRYECPTAAAAAVKLHVLGRPMRASGWAFWRFTGTDGREHRLSYARSEFLKKRK